MTPFTPAKTDSILVLGAGELGMSVMRHLARQAQGRIAVMWRPPTGDRPSERQRLTLHAIQALGIEVLVGDAVADSEEQLARLFGEFDVLISCLGFVAGAGTQLKLSRAALRSDLKRYLPWQFGVDYDVIGWGSPQDLFDEQLQVRQLLRGQSRVQWLIISTGMFTSFLFEPAFGVVDLAQNKVRALGSWDTAVTLTTSDDIGRLTATILFDPLLVNQVVHIAGDTLTYGQLADTIDERLGRTVERVEWTHAALQADLAAAPDDSMRKYRAVFAQGKGVAWDKAGSYNGQRRLDTTTVAQWIDQHLE
jgi:NAD(P)-dependent dehydrogenase (short-subunit alcohol dehydrogenase family)